MAWLPALWLAGMSVHARDDTLQLAMLRGNDAVLMQLHRDGRSSAAAPLPVELRTPLGSLWKLFVHAHLSTRASREPDYVCNGRRRDEVYCCERGAAIDRDDALVRSCGAYFEPARLALDPDEWRNAWRARWPDAPVWLLDLAQLTPATEVPVLELLTALTRLPKADATRALLLDVTLTHPDSHVTGQLGAQWRVKTWSWHRGNDETDRIGGFAGWLVDGTPVWAMASGTSRSALSQHATGLARVTDDASLSPAASSECIEVNLFARYPLAHVRQHERNVRPGALRGDYTVQFANGNRIDIRSHGELFLLPASGGRAPRIVARFDREDYVARVLDREAAPQPHQAARALAVAIRSYLQQNRVAAEPCARIDDSSATQRVAPRPASEPSRAVAAWTRDLVISGVPVRYHLDEPAVDRLAWTDAVAQANAGARYDEILRRAFPRGTLARWDRAADDCLRIDGAHAWLREQVPRWRQHLDREVGYAQIDDYSICRLASGRPHVDRARRRIYIRALRSQQDRLDLAHEYLHLAFDAHPNGWNEAYVEALARRLLLE